jgi:hypothetical protein
MSAADHNSPTADVYSGDMAVVDSTTVRGTSFFLFTIEADAEPDVLARVAALFNIANVAPHSASLSRESSDHVKISIGINLTSAITADMIRRKLEQLTCLISVLLTSDQKPEKRLHQC